jgi:hypothetical protein
MEPDDLLSHLQEATTGPHSEPAQVFLTDFSHLDQGVPRYYFVHVFPPKPRMQLSSPP